MNELRIAREDTGLSQERVAALLDPPVSERTIRRWEQGGEIHWHRRYLPQLAELYGVSVEYLKNGAKS